MSVKLEWLFKIDPYNSFEPDTFGGAMRAGPVCIAFEASFKGQDLVKSTARFRSPCCRSAMESGGIHSIVCVECLRIYDFASGRPGTPLQAWPGLINERVISTLEEWFQNFTNPLDSLMLAHELLAFEPHRPIEPLPMPGQRGYGGADAQWDRYFSELAPSSSHA